MATLTSYISEVRRLLHDANGVFWDDAELTDNINSARERVVRDTGCLRTLQITQTPISTGGNVATNWAANTVLSAGDYIFSNIFIYEVTVGGTTGSDPPPYPSSYSTFPPSTPFTNGTTTMQYSGPAEIIAYAALPNGQNTLDVMNVNVYWGNSRIPLRYLPWTNFNAQLRYWQNYVGRPVCFSIYGQGQIYIAPIPDQSYAIEIDTVIMPTPLTTAAPSTVDTIVSPYTSPVAFYAAYKAKYKEQSYGEAEIYKQEYMKQVNSVQNSVFTRRIPDPYSSPY
jgi:hypothetical protein